MPFKIIKTGPTYRAEELRKLPENHPWASKVAWGCSVCKELFMVTLEIGKLHKDQCKIDAALKAHVAATAAAHH